MTAPHQQASARPRHGMTAACSRGVDGRNRCPRVGGRIIRAAGGGRSGSVDPAPHQHGRAGPDGAVTVAGAGGVERRAGRPGRGLELGELHQPLGQERQVGGHRRRNHQARRQRGGHDARSRRQGRGQLRDAVAEGVDLLLERGLRSVDAVAQQVARGVDVDDPGDVEAQPRIGKRARGQRGGVARRREGVQGIRHRRDRRARREHRKGRRGSRGTGCELDPAVRPGEDTVTEVDGDGEQAVGDADRGQGDVGSHLGSRRDRIEQAEPQFIIAARRGGVVDQPTLVGERRRCDARHGHPPRHRGTPATPEDPVEWTDDISQQDAHGTVRPLHGWTPIRHESESAHLSAPLQKSFDHPGGMGAVFNPSGIGDPFPLLTRGLLRTPRRLFHPEGMGADSPGSCEARTRGQRAS